jgi:hypothetical protein
MSLDRTYGAGAGIDVVWCSARKREGVEVGVDVESDGLGTPSARDEELGSSFEK